MFSPVRPTRRYGIGSAKQPPRSSPEVPQAPRASQPLRGRSLSDRLGLCASSEPKDAIPPSTYRFFFIHVPSIRTSQESQFSKIEDIRRRACQVERIDLYPHVTFTRHWSGSRSGKPAAPPARRRGRRRGIGHGRGSGRARSRTIVRVDEIIPERHPLWVAWLVDLLRRSWSGCGPFNGRMSTLCRYRRALVPSGRRHGQRWHRLPRPRRRCIPGNVRLEVMATPRPQPIDEPAPPVRRGRGGVDTGDLVRFLCTRPKVPSRTLLLQLGRRRSGGSLCSPHHRLF